jgi:hypothetical protein
MMSNLNEGIEAGDLEHLIHPELHIDEYKSKLGRDKDVCVVSFKVTGKGPAADLVNFTEKGYDWVIDSDVSSGEMDDGDYIVFMELDRDEELCEHIMQVMTDLMNVTNQDLDEWRVRYYKHTEDHKLTLEDLKMLVPNSPEAYQAKYGKDELDSLRNAAGVEVKTKAPKNDMTESLRTLAGITR